MGELHQGQVSYARGTDDQPRSEDRRGGSSSEDAAVAREEAARGMGCLVVSSDLPELLALADAGVFDSGLRFRSMVFPDSFIDQDSPARMYAVAGMNAEHIEAKVLEALGISQVGARRA